ncbi:hypothetical protein GOODEAATRI_018230, partial [Goodea atripinnis]
TCHCLNREVYLTTLRSRYDEELGVVYMAARLAGGYAAVRRVLNEVDVEMITPSVAVSINPESIFYFFC